MKSFQHNRKASFNLVIHQPQQNLVHNLEGTFNDVVRVHGSIMVRELQNEEKAPKLDILTTELVPKTPNPVVNASESLESPGIGNWLSSPLSSIAKNNSSYASHVLSALKNNSTSVSHVFFQSSR